MYSNINSALILGQQMLFGELVWLFKTILQMKIPSKKPYFLYGFRSQLRVLAAEVSALAFVLLILRWLAQTADSWLVNSILAGISFPNFAGEAESALNMGMISYEISEVSLGNFEVENSKISSTLYPQDHDHLIVNVTGLSLGVAAMWQYRKPTWPIVEDKGHLVMLMSNTSLHIVIEARNVAYGRTNLTVPECKIAIGKIEIKVKGGKNWMYNVFSALVVEDLKRTLQLHSCNGTKHALENHFSNAIQSLQDYIADSVLPNAKESPILRGALGKLVVRVLAVSCLVFHTLGVTTTVLLQTTFLVMFIRWFIFCDIKGRLLRFVQTIRRRDYQRRNERRVRSASFRTEERARLTHNLPLYLTDIAYAVPELRNTMKDNLTV